MNFLSLHLAAADPFGPQKQWMPGLNIICLNTDGKHCGVNTVHTLQVADTGRLKQQTNIVDSNHWGDT